MADGAQNRKKTPQARPADSRPPIKTKPREVHIAPHGTRE